MEEKITIIAVCQHCLAHNSNRPVIEINFKEQSIYYICPECKKNNHMTIKTLPPLPLPKSRFTR